MKKITVIMMIVCLSVGILAVSGLIYNASAAPPSPLVYEAYPAFMSASVSPLVMLVMGRNHKLYYEAYNDASDLNGDGTLDVGYNTDIEYYGYFDSYKVYKYDNTDKRFEPVRVTSDKKTSGNPADGEWSGDYLNYLTMSRMDTLRKVLYGGYRSTDTATETVLQRVYVPQDAHSWGKEYTDVATDGYDISDYAPFALPNVGTRHLFASTTLFDNGDPLLRVLTDETHRIWEWVSIERPVAGYRVEHGRTGPLVTPVDYEVRVLVGVSSMPEVNCKEYPSGVYKPVGILQRHGETNSMYFGLLTGSYAKNTSGGVLRKKMGSITDEINPDTGQFIIPTGGNIIDTINRLRITEYRYGYWDYEPGWTGAWVTTRPMNEGEFPDWGNPTGEMMYEGLRYFAGKATPTTDFYNKKMDEDDALGLPNASWDDPYTTYAYCAKPFMLVLSDINPTYDSDQLPGSYFGSAPSPNDLSGLNVDSIADTIFTAEGLSGLYYIGQEKTTQDGSCAPKTVSGFGDIRGLCPEEPTKQGSYYSASVANFGRTQDINPIQGDQNVLTYTVALASPLPKIEIPIGGNTITLVPFAKSVGGGLGIVGTEGEFQPTNTIVDFYVETITPDSGKFRINFEDVEQAADHDMDAIVEYEYQVTGNTVAITLTSTYAAGGIIQHVGYIISGTTTDGSYLEVRDFDTTAGNDLDYFLDTPAGQGPGGTWADAVDLPLTTTRTFTVGTSSGAELLKNPLWYAAKWGGFEDKNGNLEPDSQDEWDKDNDGTPDTYFYVVNPLKLEEQLNKSFANILEKAASGTAASVLATNSEGEGNLVQAYFKPKWTTDGGKELTWLGFIQSLWVDSCGNLREDSNQNQKLDLHNTTNSSVASGDVDKIITYFTNTNGVTLIRRYTTHHMYNPLNRKNCDCVLDSLTPPVTCPTNAYDEVALNEIEPIYEAGSLLARRTADDRKIFTFIDGNGEDDDTDTHIDQSGEVEGVTKHVGRVSDPFDDDPFDDADEVIRFHINNSSSIKPFLGVKHTPNWSYLDANPGSPDHDSRVENLIEYIRGKDDTDLTGSTDTRSRTDDNNQVWKLGDIVNSTPMSIAKPPEKYHIIYQDPSYQAYYTWAKDRETVVYAGGNDGMLHAFTSWRYDRSSGQYFKPTEAGLNEQIGDEIWAYIPQTLLPHLKWLADPDYTHSFYVDQRPKVFDAKIIDDNTHYDDPDSDDDWGTILLIGLNMGGKHCWAEGDFDSDSATADVTRHFYPTYICMDISDPRNPRLLWERSYENLGMSRSTPAVVKIKTSPTDQNGKWFVVFGSGPNDSNGVSDYSGMSDQNGYIFVVDLKTGDLSKAFDTGESNAFMNSPVSFDKDLSYNVDAIYCGSASKSGSSPWSGKAYKINTHNSGIPSTDVSNHWTLTTLFDAEKPITASFGLSVDGFDNVWAYFGTGRYIGNADKTDEEQQYFFGIKDPYFNTGPKNTSSPSSPLDHIFNATPYSVYTNGLVTSIGGLPRITSWKSLIEAVRNTEDQTSDPDIFDGWYRTLTITPGEPSEKVISKPGILGGITFFPGYTPNDDMCGYGGDTNFYGLYYETGTAYYKSVLPGDLITVPGEPYFKVDPKIYIGHGVPPPSIGFHLGRQKGAKAFLQLSTGAVIELPIDPAFSTKSGITRWREP